MKDRHNFVKRILALALCFVLCLTGMLSFAQGARTEAATYEERLKEAEKNRADLQAKKDETAKELKRLQKEQNSILKSIEELDLKMNETMIAINELTGRISETEEDIEKTRADLEEAKAREAEQYDAMKRRIRYIYENGNQSYFEALMGAGSISDILNQVEYMFRITDYDNKLLDRYEAAREAVNERELMLEATLDELESLKESSEFEYESLQALSEVKAAQIEEYTMKIGITDEMFFEYGEQLEAQEITIAEMKEEERKRQEEAERLKREAAERSNSELAREAGDRLVIYAKTDKYYSGDLEDVKLSGETNPYNMIWPLPGDYRTYSKFGPRKAPIAGASTFHKGWDIGGDFGAIIVAACAGTVTAATYSASGGNYVRIDHGNGYATTYCHCSEFLVDKGDYVQQGQHIAKVGSTGISTAPHLHFSLALNGESIDPEPYLPVIRAQ